MNTLSYKTISANKQTVERCWYIVDAEGETVGRLASKIAHVLRGKHKPSYTPHVDTGDFVIIINADKVRFTGSKWDKKEYITFTGYPGGQRRRTAAEQLVKKPTEIMRHAVYGMLPKNTLGAAMLRKLHIYVGAEHPHAAQQPKEFNF